LQRLHRARVEVSVEIDGRQQRDSNVTNEFPELAPIALQGLSFRLLHGTTLPTPLMQEQEAAIPHAHIFARCSLPPSIDMSTIAL
jgi:hypothetical protein